MIIVDRLRRFADAAAVLNSTDAATCAKVTEVAKRVMWERARMFVLQNATVPLLYSYSGDGTPMTTKARIVATVSDARVVHRSGGNLFEYLMQKAFLKRVSLDGSHTVVPLFRDPVVMSQGKDALQQFAACEEFFPTLRECGHTGIAVSHYCFDRAGQSAMERLLRQKHALRHPGDPDSHTFSAENFVLWLKDWVLSCGCANHDSQNGLKWGISRALGEDPSKTMKDMFIVIESVRNAYSEILRHLMDWLREVVVFDPTPYDEAEVTEFWTALGVDADVCEEMASLNPVWRGGHLYVSVDRACDENLLERLSGAALYVFRFKRFTESRWTTIGDSCRTLCASIAFGIQGLLVYIRRQPKTSEYYIHGVGRLSSEVKSFAVIAAVAAYVPDGFLRELLEDDRVMRRTAELRQALTDELCYVSNLSDAFWRRLSDALAYRGGVCLRADTLRASNVSAAYITKKVLHVVSALPWSLTEGDVNANLTALSNGPDVSEPTAMKIQALLRMGMNMTEIADGVRLFMHVHFSTTGVEQGHGSAAAMHRMHRQYGSNMLCMRTFCHMTKAMLPSTKAKSTIESKIEVAMQSLEKKRPSKARGRHEFYRQLVANARTQAGSAKLPQDVRRSLMKRHGEMYLRMSPSEREGYERKAMARILEKSREHADDIEYYTSALRLHRARLVHEDVRDVMLRLGDTPFRPEDLAEMDRLLEQEEYTGSRVEELRELAIAHPARLSPEYKARLHAVAGLANTSQKPPQAAAWAKFMCWNRDLFFDSIVRVADGGTVTYYAFLFASQNPLFAAFLPLQAVERDALPNFCAMAHAEIIAHTEGHWKHMFRFTQNKFLLNAALAATRFDEVSILQGSLFYGGEVIVSHDKWTPLAAFQGGASMAVPPTPDGDNDSVTSGEEGDGTVGAHTLEYSADSVVWIAPVDYAEFRFPENVSHTESTDI